MKFGITKKNEKISTDLDFFRNQVAGLFDDFFKVEPVGFWDNDWVPALDLEEDGGGITVKAELPGMTEKDIEVHLERNVLTISGEKKEEKKVTSDDTCRIITERSYGSFKRSIALPEGIKSDGIQAGFTNGVLSVRIPREKTIEQKKIKIEIK